MFSLKTSASLHSFSCPLCSLFTIMSNLMRVRNMRCRASSRWLTSGLASPGSVRSSRLTSGALHHTSISQNAYIMLGIENWMQFSINSKTSETTFCKNIQPLMKFAWHMITSETLFCKTIYSTFGNIFLTYFYYFGENHPLHFLQKIAVL